MKNIIKSGFIVVAVAAIAGIATYSYFSDTATSGENTFSTGTLSIDDSKLSADTEITLPAMAPGDVSDEYEIIIENNGTMNLAWLGDWQFSAPSVDDQALYNALYFADAKMEFLNPGETASWLDDPTSGYEGDMVDHFITNGVPSGPYGAYMSSIIGSYGVVTFNAWNNNSLMVPGSSYEHAGALKPNYKYKLTVKFGLASGAGNEYQNLGPVTAKLKVDAAQLVASQISDLTGSWADMTWLNNQIADQTE